jgi:hypothetical protein
MRNAAIVLSVAAASLVAATNSSATSKQDLVVLEGGLKFPRREAADGTLRGKATFEARFLSGSEEYRPEDGICLMLGPCAILQRGRVSGEVLGRVDSWGVWTVLAREPFGRGSKVKLTFNPNSGYLTLKSKGVDLAPIARSRGGEFDVQFLAGKVLHVGETELVASSNGVRWNVVAPTFDPSTPGVDDVLPTPPVTGGTPDPDPIDVDVWMDIDLADPGPPRW